MIAPFALEPKGTVSARMVPLGKSLIASGHTVAIVVPPWDYPSHSGKRFTNDGVPVINVGLPPKIPVLWYLLLTLSLLKTAVSLNPQVAYCFKPKGFSGMLAILLSALKYLKLTSIKVVVDSDDWEGDGGWNDVLPYPWWQKKVFGFQEGWLLKHAESLTLASRKLVDIACEMRGTGDNIFYVPNGAETTTPKSEDGPGQRVKALHRIANEPVVLLYTRFVEFTPERVVDIMRQVESQGGSFVLLVVGEGAGREGEQLERLWQDSNLKSRLIRSGWVPAEETVDYISAADLAIYPMDDNIINQTKCPAKLVEIMSAGVPVIADAVGQAKEYIRHNVSGLLIEPGDDNGFGRLVKALLEAPEERVRLGQGGLEEIENRFLWSNLAKTAEEALTV